MSYVRREVELPERPVLIVALEGWIDPGFAAQSALAALLEQMLTRTFVAFNGDDLIDHRARRPRARVRDGQRGRVMFPAPRLRVGRDLAGMGVALLVGPEPDYRWKEFATEVTALAVELECPLVVGLGGYPSPVPHTRPIALTSTASTAELATLVGFRRGAIEVPAGIGEVVGSFCSDAGIPSVGIWAGVPHYVGAMPYAPAALALVEGLASLTNLSIDLTDLRANATSGRQKVDELIAQSDEHKEMVRQLEEQYSEEHELAEGEEPNMDESMLPSGDELIEELERYLRGEFGRVTSAMPVLRAARAVIFDMDGLIVDSEPHWRRVERSHFAELGVDILPFLGHGQTMGLRVDEAVAFLARSTGLTDVDERALASRIVDGMVQAISEEAEMLPGVFDALDLFEEQGMAIALASGSTPPVIDAVLDRFGLRSRFSVVTSAIDDVLGKPNPSIFLRTAAALGVEATRTMVLEDSLNGVIAAKAARMSVVAIPHPDDADDLRYSLADLQLTSLVELRPLWEDSTSTAGVTA